MSLAVDHQGAAYVAAYTNSTDFPTTSQSAHDPSPNPTVVAKLDPDGTLQYAATFPFAFYTNAKPIQLDGTGSVVLASNVEVMTVSPDGSSLARTLLPAWSIPKSLACTVFESTNLVCPGTPWVLPRSGGGFQFAGTAASGVPVTADALQPYDDTNGYVRIRDGQAEHPLAVPVSGFAVDPQDRNRTFAATSSGLFLTQDNGSTWVRLYDGPCLAIAVDPFDSSRLYLSVDAVPALRAAPQLYRSTDGGANWTSIYSNSPLAARITSLAADPNVRGLLYGAGPWMFRSTDGGDTWDYQFVGPSRQDMSPSASIFTNSMFVQVDPTHPGWAYVAGITRCIGFCPITQDLSQTRDGGNSWSEAGLSPGPPIALTTTSPFAVDPDTGDVVEGVNQVPAGNQLLIYRNGDFSQPQVLFPAETTSIAFDSEHPGTIYLAVRIAQGSDSGYFVVKSCDSGVTWTQVLQFDRPVYGLTVGAGGVLHGSQTPDLPKGYVLVTDASGNIGYGSYLGGAFTQVNAAATSGGRTFVAGKTLGGLPLMDAVQPGSGGSMDGFVAVFDDSGTLQWSTYLGGSGDESIDWVLPLADGSAVVVGTTSSADFPNLQLSPMGIGNTFIVHVRP